MDTRSSHIKALGRIKNRPDFLCIQSKGQKWTSHALVVQTMKNDLGQKRVGFTVTKRVHKSAVKRNRIKRRMRAIAADILPIHAKDGYDYILVGRALTATRPYETLKNDLLWCLDKMNLLNESSS